MDANAEVLLLLSDNVIYVR